MTLRNLAVLSVALGLVGCSKPVEYLTDLNGCYEGKGSPDFMRPPVHWAFRISDGLISDRAGKPVSKIGLTASGSRTSSVTFSPGIYVTDDEHKELTVIGGDTRLGTAYLLGGRAIIVLHDASVTVMRTTSCG
jgi:hypothetical protein